MTSASARSEPAPIPNSLSFLVVFMPAPRTVVTALTSCAYLRTPRGRSHPQHSDVARCLAPGLAPPYLPLPVPPFPKGQMSHPQPSLQEKLSPLPVQRGPRAARVVKTPPTAKDPTPPLGRCPPTSRPDRTTSRRSWARSEQ